MLKENSQKVKYYYLLTPNGIREKSLITKKFLICKKADYEALREEIYSFKKLTDDDRECDELFSIDVVRF